MVREAWGLGNPQSRLSRRMGADPNSACVAAPAGPSRQEQRGAVTHGADKTAQTSTTNVPFCSHTLSGRVLYTLKLAKSACVTGHA